MPKPLQPGGVPIWVSGTLNARVVRRLARFGSGWIPWGPAAADPSSAVPAMRRALEAAGHDPSGLQVVGTLSLARDAAGTIDVAGTVTRATPLVAAGVTDLRVRLSTADQSSAALRDLVVAVHELST
jgi:alkanesulfonate monooxygenase SsuD/methylene tetrahydromethanopterin reductase-like flavin-dependent oxidoreductase (luciferase family)